MAETERFNLLSRLVAGELQLKEVKGEALKIKRLSMLRRTMRTLTRSKTWDECVQRYPIHTQDSALEQFLGKFKAIVVVGVVKKKNHRSVILKELWCKVFQQNN